MIAAAVINSAAGKNNFFMVPPFALIDELQV